MQSRSKKPTLSYFNVKGRGEPARMMLAHAKVDYIDDRIEQSAWPALKMSKFGGAGLPVLTLANGKQLCQSQAVFRLLARQYNYYPTNVDVQLAHDWVADNYVDLFGPMMSALVFEKDPAAKAEKQEKFFGTQLPTFMNQVCKYINSPGRWLFGDKICAADFMVGRVYTDYMCDPASPCHDKFR